MSSKPSSTRKTAQRSPERSSLDTITASLVARQSRAKDDNTMSVPDQIKAMQAYCVKHGITVGSVYTEQDVSGRRPLDKRIGLHSAVVDVEQGRAQMILTAYFDRFVRSVQTRADVLVRVEAAGGSVMTMDFGQTSNATPVSKLTGTMLAAVSEFIAEQAGEKTHVSKQRNIDNGIPPFPRVTAAYVKREDGRLEQHPVNGPIVHEACELRAKGVSLTKLAYWMHDAGLVDKVTGEPLLLQPSRVKAMLASPLLIGEIHFGDFTPNLRAIDDPVCSKSTWRRMHKAKATRGRYSKSERLLARQDVLVCETCGSRMSVHTRQPQHEGHAVYYGYRCGNRLCETPAMIPAHVAEDACRDEAIALSAKTKGRASRTRELEVARVASVEAQTRYDNAIRTLAGRDDEAATRDVLDELQTERDNAVAEHERLDRLTASDRTVTASDWDVLTLDERRGVVRATIASAVVSPGRGGDARARIVITPRELLRK